jgi:hypothetical protein
LDRAGAGRGGRRDVSGFGRGPGVGGRSRQCFGTESQDSDAAAFLLKLVDDLADRGDARAARYWALLAIINGWPPFPDQRPGAQWLIDALRSSAR